MPTTKKTYPLLIALADACNAGACNPSGLIRSMPAAIDELETNKISTHPAVKCILGQLSYLCGESTGPSLEAVEAYDRWKAWVASEQPLTWEQTEAIHTQKQRWS